MRDLELDDPLPARVVPYGCKSHPMYKQWLKMMDSCTDPSHSLYPHVGGKGITVMHRWFDFQNFVDDNEHLFEDEPSKPANLRHNFLRRKNLRAGFNPKNVEWVSRKDAVAIQAKTICVDTYYGKNMPIKQLAELLARLNADREDLPPEAPTWTQWQRVYNGATDKYERKLLPVRVVPAIKLHVLRKRVKDGLTGWDLLEPVREYGTDRLEEDRESALCERLDRDRQLIPDDAPYYVKNRGFF